MRNAMTLSFLTLSLAISTVLAAQPKSNVAMQTAEVKIPLHVRYAAKSAWTDEEIQRRLTRAKEIFKQSCNIQLDVQSMVPLEDPSLQDMPGALNENGIKAKRNMRRDLLSPGGPVLLYVRNGFHEDSPGSETTAQAYMLGDRHSPGNLFLTRFYELKDLHGTIVISDRYSLNSPKSISSFRFDKLGPMDVDAHEIGHILLNDAGHNAKDHNIMSYLKTASAKFSADQCARMRTYHEREKTLLEDREQELAELCTAHEKARREHPTVCEKARNSISLLPAPAAKPKSLRAGPKGTAP